MSSLEMLIKDNKTVQEQGRSSKSKVFLIAIVAATGGLLFGFDTGVISGALPFLREYWKMSDKTVECVTTTVLLGAVLGAITSGKLSDLLGRKKMIIINAVIFSIGALGCAFARNTEMLIIMRIVVGIAIGITSYVAPIYIAEVSPTRRRGALVTLRGGQEHRFSFALGVQCNHFFYFSDSGQFRWHRIDVLVLFTYLYCRFDMGLLLYS